jgi:hypothetical protein
MVSDDEKRQLSYIYTEMGDEKIQQQSGSLVGILLV